MTDLLTPPNLDVSNLHLPTFEEHLTVAVTSCLYHYTNQISLLGIINTAELWATKVQHMNDSMEFKIALEIAKEHIKLRLNGEKKPELITKLKSLISEKRSIIGVNIFASCFCENGDLLSQWRGYADRASGYAIGFGTSKLIANAAPYRFQLGKCIYSEPKQKKIIDEIIDACLQLEADQCAVEFERALCRVGAFFKDGRFEEENEWRLVSPVTQISDQLVAFRPGKSMLIPYFRMPLSFDDFGSIAHLSIGPCPHPQLSKDALRMLLLNKRVPKPLDRREQISNSAIPYRDW